ncbi:hypothetical protein JMA_12370 [Jeotgalibacillus malaysiensis]|uniref:Uncharacterized protein n=1 Tax=Jeotgalibacillus malaysiensis TaxID=1508404 RepID=A0A0B5AR36_9BACL|nr:hypothetical protein [Jeotgalibacillus malaysiensis]AJD90554.1 hypothetical protein JMA_12370 [Jeotgalibacillus malaysiensis]
MKTVLFLVQNHLSSCTILADELKENATEDLNLMLRGTFTWQDGEMSENSFEGIKGPDSENRELKTLQLQRSDLEQADVIIVVSFSVEAPLKHLLKATQKEHTIIRLSELSGRSMEELEEMLEQNRNDDVMSELRQKSVELAAKM